MSWLDASGYEIVIFLVVMLVSCVVGLVVPPSVKVSPKLLGAGCLPPLLCAGLLNAPLLEDFIDRLVGPIFLVRETRARAKRPPFSTLRALDTLSRGHAAVSRARARQVSLASTPFVCGHTLRFAFYACCCSPVREPERGRASSRETHATPRRLRARADREEILLLLSRPRRERRGQQRRRPGWRRPAAKALRLVAAYFALPQ